MRATFVGRDRELDVARSVLNDERTGAVLITGVAGIGKTSLLGEIEARAADAGWEVERTAGSTTGRGLPFAPFLHLQAPDAPPSQGPAEQLVRLRAELRLRTTERPLLVLVDDAHLLDDASVVLLHQLATRDPIAIALAARSDEPLSTDIVNLIKDGHARRIDLDPLTRSESDCLVATLLDGALDPDVTDEIWRIARGNPLFVRELLGAARERGTLRREGRWKLTGPLGSSSLLREMIGQRLELLDDEHRSVLEALAVAGPLRWTVVEQLSSLATIAELETAGLVHAPPDGDTIDTGHPLHAEVTIELAPAARLQIARRSVADALEASRGATATTDLLLRARLRLDAGESEPELFLAAAKTALQLLDPHFALRCADAAVRGGMGIAAETVRASALGIVDADGDADALFTAVAAKTNDPDVRAGVLLQHAQHLLYQHGDVERASAILRQGIEELPGSVAGPLRSYLSYVAFYAGRPDEASRVAEPLLADASIPVAYGVGLGYVSAEAVQGRPERSLEVVGRAFRELRTLELEPAMAFTVPLNFIWIRLFSLWQLGRATEGDRPLDPLIGTTVDEIIESADFGPAMAATQAIIRGHLDSAIARHRSLGSRLWTNVLPVATFNATLLATAYALQGGCAEAREQLAFVDSTPPEARAGFRWWTERARMLTMVAEGDVDGGVKRSRELADDYPLECFSVTTSLHDVVRLGHPELVVDDLASQATRDGATWWDHVCTDHARALHDRDITALLEVAARFEAGGLDLHAAETLGQVIRILGPGVTTARAAAQLAELIERCGRIRTPALATHPALLSTREREVARLAAGGLSNREIAERLGTSARTVGNQLQHVYEKLGVHSRDELAVVLARS